MKENDGVGKDFWDSAWKKKPFGKYYGIEKYQAINKKLDLLFKKFLEKGDKKVLEIGCAKAKQLIYFAKEFNYEIYGVDYSKKGVEIARENLRMAGVKGTILCEDIFQTTFEKESFDIVYSMGLIEHFENPSKIIDAHIKLLKRGGILIITIPNFKDSLYFTLHKILGKEKKIIETHNLGIMDKERLRGVMLGKGVKVLTLDYFGPIELTMIFNDNMSKPILYLMHIVTQIVGYSTFFIPKSRYFSPYLILIAEKMK